jgi:SAM-dependent methyltransferase
MFNRKIPAVLHPVPIEELDIKNKFDLVVMINVVEHCYDVNKIFRKIMDISRPGSIFVFYDKYFDKNELNERIESWYDAGHPLRVSGDIFDEFLKKNFYALLYKINYFSANKRGLDLSWRGLFFIGKIK